MDERQLREVFEQCDVGWVFGEDDAGQTAQRILREMAETDRVFQELTGRRPFPPLTEAIAAELPRLKPLVQTFASPMTAPIRAMVYAILDGAQIKAIRFEYHYKAHAHLEVELEYDSGERAQFTSDDLFDAEALRHFGLMKASGAPVIDGYYAFRKDRDS